MVEVIKLFIIWLTVWIKEKENYSSGSHQFTSGGARVYRFIHRLKPRAKLSTRSSVKFTTGKLIMIVTASKRYFSRLVPQLDFFPTFVAKLQGEKVFQNSPNKRWKKLLMLQNELLRRPRSSYSLSALSTIYLRLLHFGRFVDELFKTCERLKLPVVIKNCCR